MKILKKMGLLAAVCLLAGITLGAGIERGEKDSEEQEKQRTELTERKKVNALSEDFSEPPYQAAVEEYNIRDFGADGTDTQDDYDAFAAVTYKALDTENTIRVIVPPGTYYIRNKIPVFSNTEVICSEDTVIRATYDDQVPMLYSLHMIPGTRIRCDGAGCTHGGYTQAQNITVEGGTWDRGTDHTSDSSGIFIFRHAENITIRNMKVRNCTDHFINVSGVKNVLIENVTFENALDCTGGPEAIFWGGYYDNPMKRYYTVEAVHTDFCTQDGENSDLAMPFDCTPAANITVQNCIFSGVRAGVGNHHTAQDPEKRGAQYSVKNNTFEHVMSYALCAYDVNSVEFEQNTCSDCNAMALLYGCSESSVSENTCLKTHSHESSTEFLRSIVFFSGVKGGEITHNEVENAVNSGIHLMNGCSGINVEENEVRGSGQYGLFAYQSSDIRFYRNIVKGSGTNFPAIRFELLEGTNTMELNKVQSTNHDGIYLNRTPECTIRENELEDIGRHGIHLFASPGCRVTGNTVSEAKGSGLFSEGEESDHGSGNIFASSNELSNSGQDGITVRYGDGSELKQNIIVSAVRDGIKIADSTGCMVSENNVDLASRRGIGLTLCGNTTVINNLVSESGLLGIYSEGTAEEPEGGKVILQENTVISTINDGIQVKYGRGSDISRNVVTEAGRRGISLAYSEGSTICKNQVSGAADSGIFSEGSEADPTGGMMMIRENWIDSPGQDGIVLRYGSGSELRENLISNAGQDGIRLGNAVNTSIMKNEISDCSRRGIGLVESKGSSVIANFISGTEAQGIISSGTEQDDAMGKVTVKRNRITASGSDGIYVKYGRGSVVNANTVSNPGRRGIMLSSSKGCEINYNTVTNSVEIPIFLEGTSALRTSANVRFNTMKGLDDTKVDLRVGV